MADQAVTTPARFPLRRVLPLVAVALFALIVALFAIGLTMDPRKLPSALLDKPAPAFDLPPLDEKTPGLKTADLKGQVTLVNFFASWCMPCRVEHPLLMRLAREGKIAVYGIAWKDGKKNAGDFLAELGNPYRRIGHDPDNKTGIDFGVYGVPETYVIDREGRIRYKVVGPLYPDELNNRVLPLIEKLSK
jgi:cytochrome c biogenesis protein CcmG/thiol:disulfide interchange protein DsbE